jgi:hypothetical protein
VNKQSGLSVVILTAMEQPLVNQAQKGLEQYTKVEAKLSGLSVQIGEPLYKLRAIGRDDKNKYVVTRAGQEKSEQVGRFDAVIASFGLSRATAYRHIRTYEKHLMTTVPITQSIVDMAIGNGVLVPSEEIDKAALQEAFLRAGQPPNPTSAQSMEIVTEAIGLAEAAREKAPGATEEQALLASFNAIFTSSYARVVGVPKFKKVDKERIFTHAEKEDGVKIEGDELKSFECAWMQTVESTFVRIVGKGSYSAWLNGGPDIVALGRGTDKLMLTDVSLNVEAA